MDASNVPESLRRRMEELAVEPAIDTVRSSLVSCFGDADSVEEVERTLRRRAERTTWGVRRDLNALLEVLGQPQEAGVLADIVAWDANWVLDDPSDEGARVFLREFADLVRRVIEEAEGPES